MCCSTPWRAGRAAPAADRLPLPRLSVRDARTAAALLQHLSCGPRRAPARGRPRALRRRYGTAAGGARRAMGHRHAAAAHRGPRADRPAPAAEERLSAGGPHRAAPVPALGRPRRLRRSRPDRAAEHATTTAGRCGTAPTRPGSSPSPPGWTRTCTPPPPNRPASPALVWTGSGGPDSGLDAAARRVRARCSPRLPDTLLHLTGVTAAHRNSCRRRRSSAPGSAAGPGASAARRPARPVRRRPRRGAPAGTRRPAVPADRGDDVRPPGGRRRRRTGRRDARRRGCGRTGRTTRRRWPPPAWPCCARRPGAGTSATPPADGRSPTSPPTGWCGSTTRSTPTWPHRRPRPRYELALAVGAPRTPLPSHRPMARPGGTMTTSIAPDRMTELAGRSARRPTARTPDGPHTVVDARPAAAAATPSSTPTTSSPRSSPSASATAPPASGTACRPCSASATPC